MSSSSITATGNANSGTETACGETRNASRLTDAVMRAAQRIWPRKTAAEVSLRTGTGVRACEYWLARKTDMSADALAALLRSEDGLEILAAVIGTAKPKWWKDFSRAIEMANLRKAQEEQRKRIERLELDF